MEIFNTYRQLLEQVRASGRPVTVLDHAPGGEPVMAVQAGGEREPGIIITAGSHATEQAGVTAAVNLIEKLATDHRVWVIPTRDPVGLNGYAYALSLALGTPPPLSDPSEIDGVLRRHGEVVYDEDGLLLTLIGDFGFSSAYFSDLFALGDARPEVFQPLRGRRIFTPGRTDIEGAAHRTYTLVVSPEGEVLHLNRYFERRWAPVETRCVQRLLAEHPCRLGFDLHENAATADHYYVTLRQLDSDEDEAWQRRMARAISDAAGQAGANLETALHERGYGDASFHRETGIPGVYRLDQGVRGEGLNCTEFMARECGIAFTSESGMHGSFADRVLWAEVAVQAAVNVFGQRYAG